MIALLLALLVIVLIAGIGFSIHLLWWVALAGLVVWFLGFFVHGASGRGGNARWYRW
ncbi:hydrophobic protein [Kitasatospora sp. NPDC088351]|uniref:hydrophobic protein n=1 Tax=unclassified Kitasatospora TaxID=2633591 RepID=UPI00341266A7